MMTAIEKLQNPIRYKFEISLREEAVKNIEDIIQDDNIKNTPEKFLYLLNNIEQLEKELQYLKSL